MSDPPYPYIGSYAEGVFRPHKFDADRREKCVREALCQICGDALAEVSYAVLNAPGYGGVTTINGDGLLHGRCLLEAATICTADRGFRAGLRAGAWAVLRCHGPYSVHEHTFLRPEVDLESMTCDGLVQRGEQPPVGIPVETWLRQLGVA